MCSLGIDHPVRMQACPREARGEQVPPCQAPEHRPVEASGNACGEQSGAAGELRSHARLDQFMQRAAGQTAAWKMVVNVSDTEGQGLGLAGAAFEMSYSEPQIGKPVLLPGMLHVPRQIMFVLMMFLLCSHLPLSQLVA